MGETVEIAKPVQQSATNPSSITVNGITFEAIVDRVWKVPDVTDEAGTSINIELRFTNQTDNKIRFNRFDTVRIVLTAPDGASLQFDGGRNATQSGEVVSPLIPQGQSLTILRSARLVWFKPSELRLIGSDDFGGIWYFDGLSKGRYELQIIYENQKSKIGDAESVWIGTAVIPAVQVEIK